MEFAGFTALQQNDDADAAKFLEMATRMSHAPSRAWYNLGVAYARIGQFDNALAAYEHAAQMPDADTKAQQAAKETREYLTLKKELPPQNALYKTNADPVTSNLQTNR